MAGDNIPGKIPPQNLEIEQSVLSCLMLDHNAMSKVADVLSPDDFYKHNHRAIYEVCRELFEKGDPIDFLSVSNRLKEKGELEAIGGNAYLTELVNLVPSFGHVASYARIVRHKRVLRDLISVSRDIEMLGYDETKIWNGAGRRGKKISISRKKEFHRNLPPSKKPCRTRLIALNGCRKGAARAACPPGLLIWTKCFPACKNPIWWFWRRGRRWGSPHWH